MTRKLYAMDALRCDAGHDLAETRAKVGHCRLCWNAYHREWKAKNPERARQITRDSMRRSRAAKLHDARLDDIVLRNLNLLPALTQAWLAQP